MIAAANGSGDGVTKYIEEKLEDNKPQFGPYEEEAIVSLILDMPEFFATIAHFITPSLFSRLETRYVVGWILNLNEKYGVVPTRELLRDQIARLLTIDEPYREILDVVNRKSNPREVPLIRARLKDWAKAKAYGLLYDEEAIAAYQRGEFATIEEIFKAASRVNDVAYRGFWFFDEFESLLDPENVTRYPTGWKRLDMALNGGPSPGEVIIWLAATNVGKCLSASTNVFEEKLSRIYELEMTDGTLIKLLGNAEVQTVRGAVKVCDLSEGDDVLFLPIEQSAEHQSVPSLWIRVKRLKPTDEYKPVEFRHLDGRPNVAVLCPKIVDGQLCNKEVEFKSVRAFGKIKTGPTIVIKHASGTLRCDPKHRILTTAGEMYAEDIVPGINHLCGLDGPVSEFSKNDGEVEDLYDIQIDSPHLYFTSGLVSHNSIWLCNNSVNSILNGLDTLHVSFEMSAFKTARRCLGAMMEVNLKSFHEHKEMIRDRMMRSYSTNKARLAIYEMNPDSASIDDILGLITILQKTKGWTPKVVVLDYLELLMSRNQYYNRDDYIRQKHVATEVCGLAKSCQALVYSATQTNRSGTGTTDRNDVAELNKAAESYGKTMPPDYVISLNQSKDEYLASPPQIRMYIAKGRECEKYVTINCNVDYQTMKVREGLI